MYNVIDIFSESGPLAKNLDDYTVRHEQQELSVLIAAAIGNHESLVCEAGTGTGKTFAYLVPAILSGRKIIISTGTKHLQDQLFNKDLPIVKRALAVPLNATLLKGRANYLCKQRLVESEKDGRTVSGQQKDILVSLRRWLAQTTTGDLTEFADLPEQSPLRLSVTSTTENCLGQDCEFYEECFVLRARRKANEADLVIVNHHLLLADLALRESGFGEILPKADCIIFDEAHQLPELATDFFSTTISSRQVLGLITDSRLAWHNDAADVKEIPQLLDSLQLAVRRLRLAFGTHDQRVAWIDVSGDENVASCMNELHKELAGLENVFDQMAARSRSLDNCWRRCSELLLLIDNFRSREQSDIIQWLETRGHGFLLYQTPLDISQAFQARLAEHACECIYTSATLAVDNDFTHFSRQLGLENISSRAWASPFDFTTQALLYLPEDMPEPGEPVYTAAVLSAALPVIRASKGHAFLLFTSHRALQQAAELIRGQTDYPVLVQGTAPRTELLEKFRNTKHAVLLGTSSFWEGVDVKGQALSCVIIDKLPFAPPDDPVFRARSARMQEQGINPFLQYQLPQAIITLKQGVGRLIRDKTDYGVLMLCDPRLITRSYGRKFISSLPGMKVTNNIKDVENFYTERAIEN